MDVAEALLAPDYVDHMPIMETPDREGLLKSVEGDGGAQRDTYMGVPPTGRWISWAETHSWKVVGGRITEHHGNARMFEIHHMLGAHHIEEQLR